jgi:peroxiredoxin
LSLFMIVALVFPYVALALAAWLGFQLIRQNGRILLQLEALQQRLGQLSVPPEPAPAPVPSLPAALPLGSQAPAFELPNLAGGRNALADFRGRRLLLIFFNPRCGFCSQMAPALAGLPTDAAGGRPLPLVLTTGPAEENRSLVQQHGIGCPVLLQEQVDVASTYQASGTPMGYLIDEEGRIASEIAVGAQALLALAEAPATAEHDTAHGNGHAEHRGNRPLSESRLNRQGLPAGTPAPDFTLPSVDGAELTLSAYRRQKVLLVFSDPQCGPCDELAPKLEALSRRVREVAVLMVSRREAEANRAKVAQYGLTFPVVLQKQWEISRAYEMFATPIAYLIDEEGTTTADVAIGVEPILALLSGAAGTNGRAKAPRRRKEVVSRRR